MSSLAILIDYENFGCPPEGLSQFIADFSKRGTIVVKRAYADWVKCAPHRHQLLANQVEMIELPCSSKGKNSVDIRLVVDAMELVFTKPFIDCFVIASADADFLPLLSRLREYNKRTIVVSDQANAHRYMKTHCDEFVNGNVYLASGRKAIKLTTSPRSESQKLTPPKAVSTVIHPPASMAAKSRVPALDQLGAIQTLLIGAWQTVGFERPFNLSALGIQLKKLNSGLDWKDYGFKSLKSMVAQMVTMGLLRIELTNGSDERIFFVNRDSKMPSAPGTALDASALGSNQKIANQAEGERELVSVMQSQVNDCIRWDNLRTLLRQVRPSRLWELQSDEVFMKLLQSMEAKGLIELRYDPLQKTYHVARLLENRSSTIHSGDVDSNEVIAPEVNAKPQSTAWTQPGLF